MNAIVKTQNSPRPLLPRLRFAEFRGEWITVELGRFSQLVTERVGVTACVPYTIAAGIGLISQEEKLGRIIAGSSLKNYIVLQRNDFAYNKSATKAYPEGFIALYAGDERAAVPNSIFTCFRVNQSQVNPSFLSELFQNNLHGKWLKTRVAVGARAHGSLQVSNDDLMAIPVPLPSDSSSLAEQQKIAACLSSLDTLITAQTQKLDTLKTHKKGLMQQLFPRAGETTPRLRFAEFQEAGEWETSFEDAIFSQISNKEHNSDLPVLAITQEHGAIPRDMIDYHVSVTDKSIESYKVVEVGDFIISLRSFQGGIEFSKYRGICSPAYVILRLTEAHSQDYFRHYLKTERFIAQMTKNLEGLRDGKMISFKQFSELELPIPQPAEQQKIAACLSSLDELITAQAQKVAALQTHKKGLMQQLFPAQAKASA